MISQHDSDRIERLLREAKETHDEMIAAKDRYVIKREALLGVFNIIKEEHPDFDPFNDAVVDGEVVKGAASDLQKAFIGNDRQLREIQRKRQRAALANLNQQSRG